MFVNFSEEVRHLLKQAEAEKQALNHPYVGSEHLFLSVLRDSRLVSFFKRYKLTYQKFRDKLVSLVGIGSKKSCFNLYTPLLKRVLENSVIEAREENNKTVGPEIIIISILDEQDGVAFSILKSLNINVDKLYYDLKNNKTTKIKRRKKLLLDEVATNLTELASQGKLDPVIGREREIKNTVEILLRRKKNNPILIGPAGVGKTAIVEGIANLIVCGACPSYLKNKKIFSLNIFSLVSGTKYRGEFEEKMKNLIRELEENQDVILFIDEIHTIVGAGGAEGAIDASNIFKPALARGAIRVIGATTIDEYKKYIEPDQALARRFQRIIIEEPSFSDVVNILTKTKSLYENYHNIRISNDLIRQIAVLSNKYLANRYEPDRSIDVLDEVCAKVSVKENVNQKKLEKLRLRLETIKKDKIYSIKSKDFKNAFILKEKENKLTNEIDKLKEVKNEVTKNDVLGVIKSKGNLIAVENDGLDFAFYDELKMKLNKKIIGQEQNVEKLVNALKKKNLLRVKEAFTIIINGKPGLGKRFLATTFLESIVSKNCIVKIDLNEYKHQMSISKLVGTTAGYVGYDNKNNVFEKIRTNPSSALIVENFNNASSEVKSLFMKIINEGKIEDSALRKIDFTNTIMVFIFNDENTSKVGFDKASVDGNDIPKFLLNSARLRIDLKPLDDAVKKRIIENKAYELINRYDVKDVKLNEDFADKILASVKDKDDVSSIVFEVKSKVEDLVTNLIDGRDKSVYQNKKSVKHC